MHHHLEHPLGTRELSTIVDRVYSLFQNQDLLDIYFKVGFEDTCI